MDDENIDVREELYSDMERALIKAETASGGRYEITVSCEWGSFAVGELLERKIEKLELDIEIAQGQLGRFKQEDLEETYYKLVDTHNPVGCTGRELNKYLSENSGGALGVSGTHIIVYHKMGTAGKVPAAKLAKIHYAPFKPK